jgi:AraC-like DNA-binding protein
MPLPKGSSDEQQYNLWISTTVGQLLDTMLDLQRTQPSVALRLNLQRCLNQTEGATRQSLASLANAAPCAFLGWVSGRVKPILDHLCHLCYQLEIPLTTLFKEVPDEWRGPERLRRRIDSRKDRGSAQRLITSTELRHLMVAALNENPPPSVAEIARRLKFRRNQTLWYREPDLCRQVAARRRASGAVSNNATQLYKKSEKRRLESILRRYLARQNPLSLNEIAYRLGYKSCGSIRARFPQLCRAIAAKRDQQSLRKREALRLAVENARTESPPPSLKEIAHRLGSAAYILTKACPETCASYKQWRWVWLDEQRNKLRLSIREWLVAEPAPTVASLCSRFGISKSYFQLRFPTENREVVQRTFERARAAQENRAVLTRKEVFKIVRDLHEENLYPSIPRVRSMLSQGLPRYSPLLRVFIDEAISQFGSAMRQRNELGRFA